MNSQTSDQTAQSTNPADLLPDTGTAAPPVDPSPEAHPRNFGSDNWAGVHPEVITAIAEANVGHTPGYGGDPWTQRFHDIMAHHFGPEAQAFPVFNGTGANVLALQSALPRWAAVITAASAHINYDETGAPEKVGGLKIIGAATENGKLTPETVKGAIIGRGSEHNAQSLAVSISQSTEWGTTYTPDEIGAIASTAHENDMILHIDGSRLGNAAAHLGVGLGDITTAAGVDIVSLGGTKNGLLGAEAVVVLNPEIGQGLRFLRKMNLQLASKMRFLSAQLLALLEPSPEPLWQRNAAHANAMARRLRSGLEAIDGVRITLPTDANAVFAALPAGAAERARERFAFYDWPGGDGEVRLMCSWDTEPGDVDELVALVAQPASSAKAPE